MKSCRLGLIQLAFALVLSACGGGGGAAPPPSPEPLTPPEFQGAYRALKIGTDFASFGSGSANGSGLFGGTETRNVLGALASGPVDADFTVDPDGALVWRRAPGGEPRFGAMTADGALGALDASGLLVLLQRTGTHSLASVQGTYRFVLFSISIADRSSVLLGTMTFDGVGGVAVTLELINEEGAVTTGLGDNTGDYTVAANGDMTVEFGPFALHGGVGLGGELIALAGGANALEGPALLLLVKEQPGSAHAGLLQGDYEAVGHRYDDSPILALPRIRARVTSDGTGDATLQFLTTVFNRNRCAPPTPAPYSVAGDGMLDVSVSGEDWRGAITTSGEVAILGGGITTDNAPAVLVLVRKRAAPPDGAATLDLCNSGQVLEELDRSGGIGTLRRVDRTLLGERKLEVSRSEFLLEGTAHGFLRFDLSGLAPGTVIASATLVTSQDAIDGDPFSAGLVTVDHVDLGDRLDPDDFAAALRPGGEDIATLSSTPDLGERQIDLTAAVQLDLADGRTTSDFRLRLLGGGRDSASVTFDDHTGIGPSTGARTRLVITLP